MPGSSYTLKTTELRLNDLALGVTGSASTAGKDMGLDLAFNAPSSNFRSILSLVPAVYAHDFDKVKTSGTIAVNGTVKGDYGDSAFPALVLNAKVDNAAFQYPDLPLPARDITMDLGDHQPGRQRRQHHREAPECSTSSSGGTRWTRRWCSDAHLRSRRGRAADRQGGSGRCPPHRQARGRRPARRHRRGGRGGAHPDVVHRQEAVRQGSGRRLVDVANLTVKGKSLPHPLAIQQASLRLRPRRPSSSSFAGTIGSSDMQASGTIDNLLGFMLRDDTLARHRHVHSNRFNLDEWQSGESELQIIPVPPKIDFGLDATVAELTYDNLKMTNARGRLRVKDQRVTLEDFRMNTLGGEIGVTGYYETTDPTKPTFDVGSR